MEFKRELQPDAMDFSGRVRVANRGREMRN
jgi:hypothetical protein